MQNSIEFIDEIITNQKSAVTSVAVSPDERYVFSVSKDGKIYGYWIRSRAFCMSTGQREALLSIAVSPDSKYLVTGTENNMVIYWKHSVVGHQITLEGHTAPVTSAVFTLDSKYIFSGGKDKRLNKWYVETSELISTLTMFNEINKLAIFSHDNCLLIANGPMISIYDYENNEFVKILEDHKDKVNDIAIGPADGFFVSVSADKTVKLWDIINLKARNIFNELEDNFSAVAIYPDGRYIAVGTANIDSKKNSIYIWQVNIAECIQELKGHKGSINSLVFSIDGKFLFSGSEDKTVISWDFEKIFEAVRKRKEEKPDEVAIEFSTKHPIETTQRILGPKTEEIIVEETVLENPEEIPKKFDEIRAFIKDGDTSTALEEALYLQEIIYECKLKEYKEPIKILLNMIKDLIKAKK